MNESDPKKLKKHQMMKLLLNAQRKDKTNSSTLKESQTDGSNI